MRKVLFVIVSVFLSSVCFSQRFFYSDVSIIDIRTKYSLVGKVKNNILVWTARKRDNRPEILVFDDEMRLKEKVKLNSFKNLVIQKIFYNDNFFFVTGYEMTKQAMLIKLLCFDEHASLQSEVLLDSISKRALPALVFNFFQSPDKQNICYIKSELDKKIKVLHFNCRFTNGKNTVNKSFGLPFNPATDNLEDYSIDENQNIYFLKTIKYDSDSYSIQISKGDYWGSTMIFAEKNIKNARPVDVHLSAYNDTCMVFGAFTANSKKYLQASLGATNIYIWQTSYNLKDSPGDSLFTPVKGRVRLYNITSQNRPTNSFYALYDSIIFFPVVEERHYDRVPNYYYDERTRSFKVEYNNMYVSWGSYSTYELTKKPFASAIRMDIFKLSLDSSPATKISIHKSDKEMFEQAKIIRTENKTNVILPVQARQNKYSLEYLQFNEDGQQLTIPVSAWKSNHSYLLNKAIETENALILPCTKGARVYFAKMALSNF